MIELQLPVADLAPKCAHHGFWVAHEDRMVWLSNGLASHGPIGNFNIATVRLPRWLAEYKRLI